MLSSRTTKYKSNKILIKLPTGYFWGTHYTYSKFHMKYRTSNNQVNFEKEEQRKLWCSLVLLKHWLFSFLWFQDHSALSDTVWALWPFVAPEAWCVPFLGWAFDQWSEMCGVLFSFGHGSHKGEDKCLCHQPKMSLPTFTVREY